MICCFQSIVKCIPKCIRVLLLSLYLYTRVYTHTYLAELFFCLSFFMFSLMPYLSFRLKITFYSYLFLEKKNNIVVIFV